MLDLYFKNGKKIDIEKFNRASLSFVKDTNCVDCLETIRFTSAFNEILIVKSCDINCVCWETGKLDINKCDKYTFVSELTKVLRKYGNEDIKITIIFKDDRGNVMSEIVGKPGDEIVVPNTDKQYWIFDSWDKEIPQAIPEKEEGISSYEYIAKYKFPDQIHLVLSTLLVGTPSGFITYSGQQRKCYSFSLNINDLLNCSEPIVLGETDKTRRFRLDECNYDFNAVPLSELLASIASTSDVKEFDNYPIDQNSRTSISSGKLTFSAKAGMAQSSQELSTNYVRMAKFDVTLNMVDNTAIINTSFGSMYTNISDSQITTKFDELWEDL